MEPLAEIEKHFKNAFSFVNPWSETLQGEEKGGKDYANNDTQYQRNTNGYTNNSDSDLIAQNEQHANQEVCEFLDIILQHSSSLCGPYLTA
jgi:hypothetical protein